MSNRYLLRCSHCDHKIEVDTRQAGQSLDCSQCQNHVQIPKLRELVQLPPMAVEVANTLRAPTNPLKSWLFTAGLAVAVLSGLSGVFLFNHAAGMFKEDDTDAIIAQRQEQIDKWSVSQLWDAWHGQVVNRELPHWTESRDIRYRKQSQYLKMISFGLMGVSGLGLLAVLCSFFIRSNPAVK